jgi:Zn-dependent protease
MTRFQKQLLSYAFTFVVYASMMNWQVALILMIGVGFHECGHLWAAKRMGLPTGGFYLFPFVGGAALITDRYRRYSHQAFTVMMGPVAGMILAFACFGLFLLTGSPIIGTAALWMALLNLFNLLPLSQMDGGQILETITFSLNETVGVVLMGISTIAAVAFLMYMNPVLAILVVVFGGSYLYQTYKAWDMRRKGLGYLLQPLPRAQTKKQITYTVLAYLGTAGLLSGLYFVLESVYGLTISGLFR